METDSPAAAPSRSRADPAATRIARHLQRSFWFGVIPVLATGVTVRYLVLAGAPPQPIAQAWSEYPVPLAAAVFLVIATLIRYWRFYLPGGRFLSSLPLELATRVERRELSNFAAAFDLLTRLRRPRLERRVERRLGGERFQAYRSALIELESAIEAGDSARIVSARLSVSSFVRPIEQQMALVQAAAFFGLVLGAAALSLILKHNVYKFYEVHHVSMLPALEPGDQVVATELAYRFGAQGPKRGDLVVFRKSSSAPDEELVKRVIGLPGDLIEMYGSHPVINGWRIPSCDVGLYTYLNDGEQVLGRASVEFLEDRAYLAVLAPSTVAFESYRVMPGEVFVLGDNRNHSIDSRAWADGQPAGLPFEAIGGRIDRVLLKNENRQPSVRSLIGEPGLELDIPGLDVSGLRDGVRRCLNQKPKDTSPPKPNQAKREARGPIGGTP